MTHTQKLATRPSMSERDLLEAVELWPDLMSRNPRIRIGEEIDWNGSKYVEYITLDIVWEYRT